MAKRLLPAILGVVAIVAACDSGARDVTDPHLELPAVATAEVPAECDFKRVERLGRDVFGPSDRFHRDLIRQLGDALGTAAAVDLAFDLIADVPDAPGPDQAKSDFTNEVMLCADLLATTAEFEDFTEALALGSFAVKGGPVSTCAAEDVEPVFAVPDPASGDQVWGIAPGTGTWCDDLGTERLVWGESANLGSSETKVTSAFRWETVPSSDDVPFTGQLLVGVCAEGPGWHLLKEGQILPFVNAGFCDALPLVRGPEPFLGHLARLVLSPLSPAPLYATSAVNPGGLGGLAGSLSRWVGVNPVAINVEFTEEPPAVLTVDDLFSVTVRVTADGGTPMPDVEVVLTVRTNQGDFDFTGPNCSGNECSDVTLESGEVRFEDLNLNKPGGYTLVATAELIDGSLIQQILLVDEATSEKFHVRQ